jgi:8-oxo-dGTP pyrophosphatase MutT (NUDIX family)
VGVSKQNHNPLAVCILRCSVLIWYTQEDVSFVAAALRETHEEVGISPAQVEILGQLGPPQLSLGGMRVWPYVVSSTPVFSITVYAMCSSTLTDQGFVHVTTTHGQDNNSDDDSIPLQSPPLSSLLISHVEVAKVFHLPLSRLTSQTYVRPHQFRDGTSYYACDVTDLVEKDVKWVNDAAQRDEIGGGREGRLEVWGLTGWYLNLLMKAFGVYASE